MTRPRIVFFLHHTGAAFDPATVEARVHEILERCLSEKGPQEAVLNRLPEVEVNFVSDPAIAEVHAQFLGDPTPTDVITFPYGEVFISVDTAVRVAREVGHPAEREATLYLIHAFLHLMGFDDHEEPDRAVMHRRQNAILNEVFREGS